MLGLNQYLIRERTAFLKFEDVYDIFDPKTGLQVGIAREKPGMTVHVLRFLLKKSFLPTKVLVSETAESPPLFFIKRGFTFLRSRVEVLDGEGQTLGYFKSRLLSLGGAFDVFDAADNKVAGVKGDWKGWNFKFTTESGEEIGQVAKQWAGLAKELFTSADNYVINIPGTSDRAKSALLLAAGLAVDIVFKEHG